MKIKVESIGKEELKSIERLIFLNTELDGIVYNYLERHPEVVNNHNVFMDKTMRYIRNKTIRYYSIPLTYNRTARTTALCSLYRGYSRGGVNRDTKIDWWEVSGKLTKLENDRREGYNYITIANIPKVNETEDKIVTIKLPKRITPLKGEMVNRIEIKLFREILYIRILFKTRVMKVNERIDITNRCYSHKWLMNLSTLPWLITELTLSNIKEGSVRKILRNTTHKPLYNHINSLVNIDKIPTLEGVVGNVARHIYDFIMENRRLPRVEELLIVDVELHVISITENSVCTDMGTIERLKINKTLVGVTDCIGVLKRQGKKLWIEIKTQ